MCIKLLIRYASNYYHKMCIKLPDPPSRHPECHKPSTTPSRMPDKPLDHSPEQRRPQTHPRTRNQNLTAARAAACPAASSRRRPLPPASSRRRPLPLPAQPDHPHPTTQDHVRQRRPQPYHRPRREQWGSGRELMARAKGRGVGSRLLAGELPR